MKQLTDFIGPRRETLEFAHYDLRLNDPQRVRCSSTAFGERYSVYIDHSMRKYGNYA